MNGVDKVVRVKGAVPEELRRKAQPLEWEMAGMLLLVAWVIIVVSCTVLWLLDSRVFGGVAAPMILGPLVVMRYLRNWVALLLGVIGAGIAVGLLVDTLRPHLDKFLADGLATAAGALVGVLLFAMLSRVGRGRGRTKPRRWRGILDSSSEAASPPLR